MTLFALTEATDAPPDPSRSLAPIGAELSAMIELWKFSGWPYENKPPAP